MDSKFLDSRGLKHLWSKFRSLLDEKIDSIEAADRSINVTSKRRVSVKISSESTNAIQLKDGLYVPKNHTLTFGAHEDFTYDGTEDVKVPVYDGSYEVNG